jgi:hypothetical protein
MSRHIALWNLGAKNDSVKVYTEETTVVTILEREDLHIFKELPGAKKPGIYILLSDDRRYVGQASGSVWSRVNDHDKKKDWWNKVVVLSREDGLLDKLQLDRIEAWLIKKFEDLGYNGDNKYSAPDTYISALQRGKAQTLLEKAESILLNDAGVDMFKRKPRGPRKPKAGLEAFVFLVDDENIGAITEEIKDEVEDSKEEQDDTSGLMISKVTLTSSIYGTIDSRYFRGIYSEYLKKAWVDYKKELVKGLSNPRGIMKTDSIASFRMPHCFKLDEDYSFYNSFSKMMIESRLDEVATLIDDEISLEVIYQKPLL